jgi:AraC-like DNA-binding protein
MASVDKTPKHPAVTYMVAMFHSNPSLSATDISPQVGLSVSRMARLFKREMGVSLVDYRNELKMDRFFRLVEELGGRRSSITVAAGAAGFRSYSQFHRLFRMRWSLGPREYFGRRARASTP